MNISRNRIEDRDGNMLAKVVSVDDVLNEKELIFDLGYVMLGSSAAA